MQDSAHSSQNPDWVRLPARSGNALVAIITIVEEEYTAVRKLGDFSEFVKNTAYLRRTEICLGVYDVILARSADRSNTPCSELVRNIVENFRPEFIILSGIAGGVHSRDGIELGDVVVADHVDWYEMRKISGGKDVIRKQAFDHPSIYLRDTITQRVKHAGRWLDRVAIGRPAEGKPKVLEGNLIAGDKILGDGQNEYQRKILEEFDKALAVDMESYGLARGVYHARSARHYNLNYLIVRGISDLVDDEGNDDQRKEWRDYAAATAAAFALCVADEIVEICHKQSYIEQSQNTAGA
ncbi:nucleoside phosphorylase [Amorphus suaedae]